MSKNDYIEMEYDRVEEVISFIYKGIKFEYKRFNGGKNLDKNFQQIFFEYLYENQGKLILVNDFIAEQKEKHPFLSLYVDVETRNILHNIFDFKSNPWIRLFFPIRQDYRYKFKNKVSFEELKEKEFHNITIKKPTRKR